MEHGVDGTVLGKCGLYRDTWTHLKNSTNTKCVWNVVCLLYQKVSQAYLWRLSVIRLAY